jgi:pantothenate kinase
MAKQRLQLDHDQLASYLQQQVNKLGSGEIFWLGIAGVPGSGKSTLSRALCEHLGELAIVIPMDGYHYYRRELDQMPNPEEAHRRRGAPFTFNAQRFVKELSEAQQRGEGSFPSFDHGTGDPIEGDIEIIKGRHRVVIVEGNYLLLDEEPWCAIRTLLSETWFLDINVDLCMQRVRERFLATGRDEQTADFRVTYNDRPNAELVARDSPKNADRVIEPSSGTA